MFEDLYDSLGKVADKYYSETHDEDSNTKIDTKKYALIVRQRIRRFLDNPVKRPKMKLKEAFDYYVESPSSLMNLQERYNEMNDLIDYINFEICPYIYDKIDILNIFQITSTTYSQMIEESVSETLNVEDKDTKETIKQLILSIDNQLLADRNMAAETGQRNAKAIDTVNKYDKKDGGHGVIVKKEATKITNNTLIYTSDNINKSLNDRFGFDKESIDIIDVKE